MVHVVVRERFEGGWYKLLGQIERPVLYLVVRM